MGLAEKIDELIMGGVNGLVYSWNYLTGRNRTDLAQLLNATAPIFEITGGYSMNTAMGVVLTSFALYMNYTMYNKFKEQETNESISRSSRARRDYRYDFENTFYGNFFGLCSAGNFVAGSIPSDSEPKTTQHLPSNIFVGLGNGLRALSCYIMKADDPPPGKNIFSRTYDWLTGRSFASQPIRAV